MDAKHFISLNKIEKETNSLVKGTLEKEKGRMCFQMQFEIFLVQKGPFKNGDL